MMRIVHGRTHTYVYLIFNIVTTEQSPNSFSSLRCVDALSRKHNENDYVPFRIIYLLSTDRNEESEPDVK